MVVPDNVLFEGGAGEYPTITCRPMKLACRCSRTTADGRCRINGCDWSGAARGLTVPVGRRIPGRALDWLERYATEQARPLIHTEQRLTPWTGRPSATGRRSSRRRYGAWPGRGRRSGRRALGPERGPGVCSGPVFADKPAPAGVGNGPCRRALGGTNHRGPCRDSWRSLRAARSSQRDNASPRNWRARPRWVRPTGGYLDQRVRGGTPRRVCYMEEPNALTGHLRMCGSRG